MKVVTIFLLALSALFFGQQQTTISPSHRHTKTPVASNAGVFSGNSQCIAKHVDPNDPQAYIPDPICTPGVVNSSVTQANISSTICVQGYTKTIRPPLSYTEPLKLQQIQQYGYIDTNPSDYEEDHLIPLELGGNPTDSKNLWPEPYSSINEKDKVENYLHQQICDGTITVSQAQTEIIQNWYTIYQQIK